MTDAQELAYKRKAKLRKKHRKVRVELVSDMTNLNIAVRKSRKGKEGKKGVVIFDKDYNGNLLRLQRSLIDGTYKTSEGHDCMRRCPCGKVRKLHKLPYYPDHVEQQEIYKSLCDFFTDKGVRRLLHEVIFALPKGLGIGLYPIQTLTNFYMSILCRLVCSKFDVKVEIYCDDVVVLGRDKKETWNAINFIMYYTHNMMHQELHSNIGMQIIDEAHFLDFVGYRFYFNHTMLRKRMKEKFKKKMHNLKDPMRRYQVAMSYKGWLMHCNGFNLWRMNQSGNPDFRIVGTKA